MDDIYVIFRNVTYKAKEVHAYVNKDLHQEKSVKFLDNIIEVSFRDERKYNNCQARMQIITDTIYFDNIKKILDFRVIDREVDLIKKLENEWGLKNLNVYFDTLSLNSINDKEIKVIVSYLNRKGNQEVEGTIPISDIKGSFEKGFLFKNSEEIEKILRIKKIEKLLKVKKI